MRRHPTGCKWWSGTGLLAVALALAGCNGGTVDRHALTNDAATLDSINCEAWLVSRARSRDRLTVYFAREQAEELALQAANFADALAQRPTSRRASSRACVRGQGRLVLASRLRRLHASPADRAALGELGGAVQAAGHCS